MQDRKNFKSIFLVKLPMCSHPDSIGSDSFRTKNPFRPGPSLALPVLRAFLEKYKTYDYKIKAVDLNLEAYTEPGIPVDTSVYPNLLAGVIKNNDYDVLAISIMFVFNVRWVDDIVKLSRKLHPEAKIMIGGGYPTLFPERCLLKHDIDDAIIGEGEATFLHILNKYNNHRDVEFDKKFPHGSYATKNEKGEVNVIKGEYHLIDLADLPMPAWDYINIEGYFKRSGDKVLPIEGSRGCPYRCSYCTSFIFCGPRIRYKPVENLINEILEIKERYKDIKTLRFIDDNLSFSKDWIKDFLTKIINLKLPLKLEIQNFSVKHLDEEIVRLLIEAGTHTFTIAVESGSPEMQKRINKNLNFNMVKDAVKMMKSHDVHIHICWMIGFPGETLEQINETFNFARELKANSNQFVTVLPYPGTQLFDEAKKANLLVFSEDDLDKFDNRRCDYVKSDQWNYDQLQKIIYDANIEMNFLNNPSLQTSAGRDKLLSFFIDNELLLSIPDHIILYLVIGYIYKQKNCYAEYEKHYNKAKELFKDEKLAETFSKYLSWDNPIIKDYNQFLSKSQ